MISVAITGGIGSGKSYFSDLLQKQGIPIYNADNEAKRLMISDERIKCDLVALLGQDVYQGNILNKKLLASYLFASSENANRINQIVHPRVKADFSRWLVTHADYDIVGLECAILFEAGFEKMVDAVIMVYAPEDVRIARVMERDQITEQQVRARIAAQMDDEIKCKMADFVVDNDGKYSLDEQIISLLSQLKERK